MQNTCHSKKEKTTPSCVYHGFLPSLVHPLLSCPLSPHFPHLVSLLGFFGFSFVVRSVRTTLHILVLWPSAPHLLHLTFAKVDRSSLVTPPAAELCLLVSPGSGLLLVFGLPDIFTRFGANKGGKFVLGQLLGPFVGPTIGW